MLILGLEVPRPLCSVVVRVRAKQLPALPGGGGEADGGQSYEDRWPSRIPGVSAGNTTRETNVTPAFAHMIQRWFHRSKRENVRYVTALSPAAYAPSHKLSGSCRARYRQVACASIDGRVLIDPRRSILSACGALRSAFRGMRCELEESAAWSPPLRPPEGRRRTREQHHDKKADPPHREQCTAFFTLCDSAK